MKLRLTAIVGPLILLAIAGGYFAAEDQRSVKSALASFRQAPLATTEDISQPPTAAAKRRVSTVSETPVLMGQHPSSMPLPPGFLESIIDESSNRVSFTLPDGRVAQGEIEFLQRDAGGVLLVQGRLAQPEGGFFFFQRQTEPGVAGAMVGNVRFDQSDVAFRIDPSGSDGSPELVERRLDQVLCMNLEAPDPKRMEAANDPQNAPQTYPVNVPIPSYQNGVIPLQSLPGAPGVIYLDFDGETGPFPGWGSFDAAPSGANNTQIREVWQRVAEDYQPFNINVTTDRRVFDTTTQGRRQHCILTPTTTAAPGAGGVSYIGSFNNTGDTVNWSFYSTGKSAAEVVSHECGHALGLGHDGRISPSEGYYGGHGNGDVGWAPIMGVGYYKNLVQWSKGEYTSANNTEDDLNIIVSNNNSVDYRTDDYGATFATGGYLEIFADNTVSNEGIIETRSDVDAFRFTTTGGAVSFTVNTVNTAPNLDILAEIYNSSNVLVASNNPDVTLNATVAATLVAGDYTMRVSGLGRGDPLGDGYTDYASLGAYMITGNVTGGVKSDRFTIAENSPNGTAVGTVVPRSAHGANSLSFSIVSGNTGGAFALNSGTGAFTVANVAQLNYEALSLRWDDPATFELFVTITDATAPALNESIRVVVTVSDVNEAPLVTGGSITMLDHSQIGTSVLKVAGSDPDYYQFPLFSIVAGNTGNAFAINAVSGLITVAADTDATVQSVYTLTVRATDQGTPVKTTDVTVTINLVAAPPGYTLGSIVRTFFESISGNAVSNLTGNSNFPNNPTSQQILTSFDGGLNHGDNYGSTIRGYVVPPTTGSYTFWISSDDGGELRISTNATQAGAVVRATVASATSQYQWNASASQQSVALSLIAGTPYYIEARHKEGGGADHVAVAWQGPGIPQQVIPGAYLAPFSQNYAPAWTNTPYVFTVAEGAANGALVGNVTATDVNADTLTFSITSGNTGGAFAINAQSGAITVVNGASLTGGQAIVLQLSVIDNGGGGVFTPLSKTSSATINVQQTLTLASPSSDPVNIPADVGLMLETNNQGRIGTTYAWTKTSGPGTVTFDNAASQNTGAAFSESGVYVLHCTETGGTNPISLDVTVNAGVVDYALSGVGVGAQAVASSHTESAGVYTISATGTGIPSSATPDDFYFIQSPATGDVMLTARIVSVQDNAGSSSRAGVMIRESLAADAREAFCGVTAANGGRFIYRATAGTASANATATVAQPYWVRLTRTGNSFAAEIAPDVSGAPGAYVALGTAQTLAMGSTARVGIAVTSGSTTLASAIVIDHVSIVPSPTNLGAFVNAGANGNSAFPSPATLDATVTDDALPAPALVITTWTKLAGSGNVTFGNASNVDTTAAFSQPGTYSLRLIADDGAVKTFDNVAITATSATTVSISASDAAAGEQGPNPGQFTFTRTGPTAGALTVNFTIAGTASASDYTSFPTSVSIPDGLTTASLALTPVNDVLVEPDETVVLTLTEGMYNIGAPSIATVTIADNDVVPGVAITSPAALNVNIPANTGLILEAMTTDDGFPNPLVLTWSKVSGPGTVSFGNASTANTTATFSLPGTYVLRLNANDGQFSTNAQVTVNTGVVDHQFTGSKVGVQAIQPSHTFASGTYTLSAAGGGIPSSGNPDDCYFLNTPVTGDVTITARIVSVQNVNGSNSRSGLMMRESLAADARQAFCGINSLGSGRWIYRATAATNNANVQATAGQPYWVRLIRSGNLFTAQHAPDVAGAPGAWTTAGSAQTIAMGSTALVGLAATSGSTSAAGTTVFNSVSISSSPVNIAASVNAGSDASISLPAPAALAGTISDDGKPAVATSLWSKLSGPGPVTLGNAALPNTSASFSAVGNYVLRLIANDGEVKTFDDIMLTVQLPPIEQWRQARFGANASNPAIAGNTADPDFDGRMNLLEYALGLDPLAPDADSLVPDLETIGPNQFLRLTLPRNPAATDVDFTIESSDNLTQPLSWSSLGTTVEINTPSQLRTRDNNPITAADFRHLRLRVTHPKAGPP